MHYNLSTPLSLDDVLKLHVGDTLSISGKIITARDLAHRYLLDGVDRSKLPFSLEGGILYHCGPIIRKESGNYEIIAAGPTTSMRLEPYEAEVIQRYGVRMVIGKAGMGELTLRGLEGRAVYAAATGGIAQVLTDHIIRVCDVYMLDEFGVAEAFWVFEVKDFPVLVSMDAHLKSLHAEVFNEANKNFKRLLNLCSERLKVALKEKQ